MPRAKFLAGAFGLVTFAPAALNASPMPLMTIDVDSGSLNRVRFSPDGRYFVTASASGVGNVFTAAGAHVARLSGQRASMFNARFDHASNHIVTTHYDGTVAVWRIDGRRITQLQARSAAVTDALFTPEGDGLILGSDDGATSRITMDGRVLWSIERPGVARNLALAPGGTLVASTSDSGLLSLIEINSGAERGRIATGQGRLNSVSFNRVAPWVLTAGRDGTVVVWALDGKRVATIGRRGGPWIHGADFDASNALVCYAGDDGTLRVATSGGKRRAVLYVNSQALTSIACRADREIVLVGDTSGKVRTFALG